MYYYRKYVYSLVLLCLLGIPSLFSQGVVGAVARDSYVDQSLPLLPAVTNDTAIDLNLFCIPTTGQITSGFGIREGVLHAGVDIAGPPQYPGNAIYAAYPGTVVYVGGDGSNAAYPFERQPHIVVINHGWIASRQRYVFSVYGHMGTPHGIHPFQSYIVVSQGEVVDQGQRLGYQGRAGNADGTHLHWEIREQTTPGFIRISHGSAVDPQQYVGTLSGSVQEGCPNQAPHAPILLTPPDGLRTAQQPLTLTWKDMGDIDNTPNPVRQFSIELRNVATGAQTVSPLQSTTAWTTPPLADGTYTWRVRAYDGALYSEWSSRRIVTVNTKYANMFADGGIWSAPSGAGSDQIYRGDIDGDKRDDLLVATSRINGATQGLTWYWLRNTGSTFIYAGTVSSSYGRASDTFYVGDIDGDGKDDLLTATARVSGNTTLTWYWLRSTGAGFEDRGIINQFYGSIGDQFFVADVDGDGKDDLLTGTTRLTGTSTGLTWYWLRSTGTTMEDRGIISQAYGIENDLIYSADFDGDGDDDMILASTRFHPETTHMTWYWMRNDGTSFAYAGILQDAYGIASDRFYVADFDGDGKDDLLTATPRINGNTTLTWYWLRSTGTSFEDRGVMSQAYGGSADQFYVADFDGDGKDDLLTATTRVNGSANPLTWYWLRSTGTSFEDRGVMSQADVVTI